MKNLNLLTFISLVGALSSIAFIFFTFEVPNSIKQNNSSLIMIQEKKIEDQNKALEELDVSKVELTNNITSLKKEIKALEESSIGINASLKEKNNKIKTIEEEISLKTEKFEELKANYSSADIYLKQLRNEVLELEGKKPAIESDKKNIDQIQDAFLRKESEVKTLLEEKTYFEKLIKELEIDLQRKQSLLGKAEEKALKMEKELSLLAKELREFKENKISIENSVNSQTQKTDEILSLASVSKQALMSLNGLIANLEGFLTYDDIKGEINFTTSDGIKILIEQDEFAGALVGSCGLPISDGMDKRCMVEIEAEINTESGRPILIGREIIGISKK